nr:hypothetical protein [Tanacetum cinerariifolium]
MVRWLVRLKDSELNSPKGQKKCFSVRLGNNLAKPDNDDVNLKFLKALPPSWSQVALTLKTKGGLEYLSFDDLYNKLWSLEIDVKGGSNGYAISTDQHVPKKAGRKINFNNKDSARFDRRKARCYNCLQLGHFTRECNVKKVDENTSVYDAAVEFAIMGISSKAKIEQKEWEVKLVESLAKFAKWTESSKNLAKLINSSMSTRTKLGQGFKEYIGSDEVCDLSTPSIFDPEPANTEVISLYERFVKAGEMHEVPPSITGTFMPTSYHSDLDETQILPTSDVKTPSPTNGFPSYSVKENLCNKSRITARNHCKNNFVRTKTCFVCGSKSHLIKDCDVYDNVDTFPSVVSTAESVPADGVMLLSPHQVHPHVNKDVGIVDSGCSRSMTGNKEKLDDFVQVKGDSVTFRGRDGKITGKGTIRTSKLDFENEFPLPDASQVVLHIPRRHDLYTFYLLDIQPEQHINCLLAKAFLAESTKWHRRMTHVNFKTINKLAKNGLVAGLPLKLFTNEHNCVACNKRKQHKASYKAIFAVRTISKRLQLLYMDLFCPTSIKSIDKKYYFLVVTDDFSRFSWAFFLGTKDETFYILKDFLALIENQLNKNVKVIRVSITTPHNKTPYELLSGKVPNISHLKPFRCHVTILNTGDHLGKFEGKATEGFLVGYATNSKAYRVYNLSNKKVEEILNLRYLEDKPNVQGLGQEWYFDLDYLTDSLGYTRFKSTTPAGPMVNEVSAPMENRLDYIDELARLHRQENDAHSAATRDLLYAAGDFAGSLVSAARDSAGSLVSAAGDSAGSLVSAAGDSAGSLVSAAGDSAGSLVSVGGDSAGSLVSAAGDSTGSLVSAVGDSAGILVSAAGIPAGSVPVSRISPGGVLARSVDSAGFGDLAARHSVLAVFNPAHAAPSTHPPALSVAVDPVATKRVNTVHPQSQIRGELQSPVQTRSQVWKLIPLPDGKIAIGTKWILKNKRDARAIRLFLAFASYMGFMVYQIDVKSAFLYGEIDEEVYVTQPKGFEYPYHPKHVYRVVKALYGLHQAPRACQDKYVKDILKKFDMESVRTATIPYEVPKPKSKDDSDDAINVHLYRSMIGSLMYLTTSRPDIMFAVSACSRHQVLLLVVLVRAVDLVLIHVDDLIPTGSCTIPTVFTHIFQAYHICFVFHLFYLHEYFSMAALQYKDDHNKVAYLEKGKGWEAYEHILDFLHMSHIWYALTYRLHIVFDSLVKQFWATATVHNHEAGPSQILANINGNEVVVTESLIRTQLQLNDVDGLYAFSLTDVLDGMRVIGYPTDGSLTFYKAKLLPQWRFLIHTLIHCIQTTDPSLRPTFDFTAKLFSNMKLNWDGPHMPLLAPMLVVPAGGDGADAVAAGAAAAHDSSPVREPTPRLVREPTPNSPKPPSPPHYPRSVEVGTTTSTRPPSLTRQTSFQADVSDGGGDFVSSLQSNEAPPTPAATAAGGAEDSAALTALSLKIDRCLNRVTSLENELGITKKVLGGVVLKLVTQVKRLEGLLQQRKQRLVLSDSEGEDATPTEQDINLEALHTLASTSLGGNSTDKAAGHDAAEVPADATMPFRSTSTTRRRLKKPFTSSASAHVPKNIPDGVGIPAAATTIPAGSSMDAAVHAVAALSSPILAVDKGKAPMVDDSLPADLLSKQERILKNLHDYQLGEDLAQAERVALPTEHGSGLSDQRRRELDAAQLIYTAADWAKLLAKIATNSALSKRFTFRPKPTLDDPSAKRANQGVPQVPTASSQVPASVPAAPSFAADVSVSAATTSEVPAAESRPADTPTISMHVFVEPYVAASTPSSSRKHRKHIPKKRVTPIVDIADDALIKFDSDSGSDDDPLPYAPYAGWAMVPSPLGSVHAYSDMAGHTKHFTSLRELLHMVEKTNLQKLLGAVDNLYQREDPDTFALLLWGDLHVYILETVDGRVIYMFVDVSYPLRATTLERMLKHGLEVPKLLVGGDLTIAEQLVTQNWMVITFHVPFWNANWLVQRGTALGKDVSNPFMAMMVCQKPLGYFSSPMIHVLRAKLVINPLGLCYNSTKGLASLRVISYLVKAYKIYLCCCEDQMLLFHDLAVFVVPAGLLLPAGFGFLLFGWLLLVLFCSCYWNKDAILMLTSEDLSRILKLMLSNSRLGEDSWELQISLSVVPVVSYR